MITTTAEIQGVQKDEVAFGGSVVVRRRRLQSTFNIEVILTTTVNLVDYLDQFADGDAEAAFASFSQALSNAASSGSFTQRLREVSQQIGATITLNAETQEVVFSEPIIIKPPTPAPTFRPGDSNSDSLNDGEIAGIVVGSIFFLAIVIVLLYAYLTRKKADEKKVYVIDQVGMEIDMDTEHFDSPATPLRHHTNDLESNPHFTSGKARSFMYEISAVEEEAEATF